MLDILQITNNPTNLCILLRTPLTLPLLPISTLLLLLFTPILLILLTVCFFLPLPPYLIHPNPVFFPPSPKGPSQPYGGQGSAGYPPNIQQASSVGMNYGQTGSYNSIPPHSINPNSPNSHLIHPPNQNVPGLIPNSHLLNHSSSPSPSSSTQPYLISQNPNANMHQSVPPQYLQQSTPPNASPFLQGQGPPPQHQQPVPHQQHSQQPGPPLSQQQPKHSSPSSASNPSQSNFNSSNNIYTRMNPPLSFSFYFLFLFLFPFFSSALTRELRTEMLHFTFPLFTPSPFPLPSYSYHGNHRLLSNYNIQI